MEGWDPTEEGHQISAWAGVGVAGDAGVAQEQQGQIFWWRGEVREEEVAG